MNDTLFFTGFRRLALIFMMAFSASAICQDDLVWNAMEPDNTVYLELQEGTVVIELNPMFAPKTVKQFRDLVGRGFYDGLLFYRVIDGFVAQGGDGSDLGERSDVPLIDAEFEIDWPEEAVWTPAQESDLFAPQTGFIDSFAVARDPREGKAWLAHCPGVVAMARNEGPDSSRTDFYIVIGQAPRYLDRNMNVFGRVVHGMDAVQRIRRGKPADNGIISDEGAVSRIRRIRLGTEIPDEEAEKITTVQQAIDYINERRSQA